MLKWGLKQGFWAEAVNEKLKKSASSPRILVVSFIDHSPHPLQFSFSFSQTQVLGENWQSVGFLEYPLPVLVLAESRLFVTAKIPLCSGCCLSQLLRWRLRLSCTGLRPVGVLQRSSQQLH